MTPATDIATNPSNPLFRAGIDSVWVQFYGCLMPLTQGDGLYTNTPILLDDPDGDLIYSVTLALNPPVPFDAGFRVNYSTETGATIQNGGGFQKGRSYYQYIHPIKVNDDGSIEWPSTFSFPVLQWMDADLTVEDPPNLFSPTRVKTARSTQTIDRFELAQNYPNPFNPETKIEYQLAEKSEVQITIYNAIGQLVKTLVNKQEPTGVYSVQWNGTDLNGRGVSSGIYFVKMTAGPFTQIRKMTLIR